MIADRLAQVRKDLSKQVAKWQLTIDSFPLLFAKLEDELKIEPHFGKEYGSINLNFSGDAARLVAVWRELRIAGWKPDDRPAPNSSTFITLWRHVEDEVRCEASGSREAKYSSIFMYFTSNVCRRVQTGTRMVEEPIYEVQCGEASSLADLI